MKSISISFKLSKSDFLNGNDVLYFRANPRKYTILFVRVLILLASAVNIYFGIVLNDNTSLSIGITVFLVPFLFEIMRRSRNGRFYKTTKVCSEEINYIFDNEKIKRESKSYSIEYKISSVNNVINSKNWIFLFLDNGQQNLIPKIAFNLDVLKEIFDENRVKNNL